MATTNCSKCKKRKEKSRMAQAYCKKCHAKYMRENGPKHRDMLPSQRMKANARTMANVYQKRGRLKKKPCADCGARAVEKHHEDYSRPLDVTWLCKKCHMRRHAAEKAELYGEKKTEGEQTAAELERLRKALAA